MKKIFVFIVMAMVATLSSFAQYETTIEITDIGNSSLTVNAEKNISSLITELNRAFDNKQLPNLKGMNIDERTKQSILMLWENSPFRCEDTDIVEKALEFDSEWQVRNLPFIFPALEKGDQYHEISINFDRTGRITSFQMAISQNLYSKVIKNGAAVKDARRRQMILDYVEQFRTAYNTKDLDFLNQVYSEDALIITGRVVTVKPTKENNFVTSTTKYSVQDKVSYLKKLSGVFKRNKTIRVTFDDIKVQMHPTEADWYGVTLKQGWTADQYHDDGWLFLLWDFTDEQHPTIHVRSWQNAYKDKDGIVELTEDEIFGMEDVNIVK